MTMVLLVMLMSLGLLTMSLWLFLNSRQRARSEIIAKKLLNEQIESRSRRPTMKRESVLILPGGVQLSRKRTVLIGATVLMLIWPMQLMLSLLPALILLISGVGMLYGVLLWRHQNRVRKMVEQTPGWLDHMVRSLKSGRTLAAAMIHAMERCQSPLQEALAPTRRSIELGVPIAEALDEFADRFARLEFRILAMGVRVNQRHGGNASELLQSLMGMIRDRERAERQLRALTGETRLSAVVLAVMPLLLIAYLMVMNPAFFLGMWHDPAGQKFIIAAMVFQISGVLLLWRMLRSI